MPYMTLFLTKNLDFRKKFSFRPFFSQFVLFASHPIKVLLKILGDSGVETWGRRGRAAPGDIISRADTKRKKLINFVGEMVKNKFCW